MGGLEKDESLTDLGEQMAAYPLDPIYAKTLITSKEYQCTEEIFTILAMLSEENLFVDYYFEKPEERPELIFGSKLGDHLMLLKVYSAFKNEKNKKKWCKQYNVNFRVMKKVTNIIEQIRKYWVQCEESTLISNCISSMENV